MHKLGTVIRHEYTTILKQVSFWAAMIGIPVLVAALIGLIYLANSSTSDRIDQLAEDLKGVTIVDESGIIDKQVAGSANIDLADPSERESLRQEVQDGDKTALIVYPENLAESRTYTIYIGSDDFTQSQAISSLADTLLGSSVLAPLGSADLIAIANNGAESKLVTYDEGRETAGFNEYIIPGIFVVLFYIIFAFSISYMLSSVGEEKENRSIEMVLTYTSERAVILGKLIGVSLIALTQVAFFAALGIVALVVANSMGTNIPLPADIDVARLVFDPQTIILGSIFLIAGFLLFAGFMTIVASLTPSMKDANNFSVIFFLGAFIPFYFVYTIMSDPENPIVRFLTFFPLTSPGVALLRNAVDGMTSLEAWAAAAAMVVFMVISLAIAVKSFRLGALEFSNRISLKQLFK